MYLSCTLEELRSQIAEHKDILCKGSQMLRELEYRKSYGDTSKELEDNINTLKLNIKAVEMDLARLNIVNQVVYN